MQIDHHLYRKVNGDPISVTKPLRHTKMPSGMTYSTVESKSKTIIARKNGRASETSPRTLKSP
jgi:hypothetical protein